MIFGYLAHLSYNMWEDAAPPQITKRNVYRHYMPDLCFDESLWNDLLPRLAAAGVNMAVIDLGDGVRYQSHPEIAVRGAWTVERLKEELAKVRALGIEPIPKLNFSTVHDAWLGEYARCVSSRVYYEVCRDLIAETIAIFDKPRFFHLGMDEERAEHHRNHEYMVVRQGDLWWRDLYFLIGEVERGGARPWVWSDYLWDKPDLFCAKMPRGVLQSNWFYGPALSEGDKRVKAYLDLEEHGYDQVPTCSNHSNAENTQATFDFCLSRIPPERLLGFIQTPWRPTKEDYRDHHFQAIELMARAIARMAT